MIEWDFRFAYEFNDLFRLQKKTARGLGRFKKTVAVQQNCQYLIYL